MNSVLETLTQRYLDGTISADEMARLNHSLNESAEARREFVQWLNVDSAVAASAAGWERPETPRSTQPLDTTAGKLPSSRRRSATPHTTLARFSLSVAAACLAILLSAWWLQSSRVAMATVVYDVGTEELIRGAELNRENYSLQYGSVELVTARGVRIVIEAPAEFQFESAQRLRLRSGRLSADVPPSAKGFTVITPAGDAVDLGTRFGVDVATSGAAEIHVFQGEVIAKASGNEHKQSLRGGDALTMDEGTSTTRDLRSSAFIQADEMSDLSAGLIAGQRARSEVALATLRDDPALIALLDFETPDPPSGVFRSVQGRWPGSRAPEFVNVGDHLKLDVGGDRDWPQLTLAAWVRLDQLGAPYHSLLHTDGWDQDSPGQAHWMVTGHMRMRLALRGNTLAEGSEEQEHFPDSKTSILPQQGRWLHLATVYDSNAKTVRFYVNGQFDKETRQAIAHPARLGAAQIGNWDKQDRKLSGRVDELLLLGRVMSDDEVRAIYEAGNPYR
jgi:hypothetical protein